jgi:succinate-acetate transporter protein
MSHIAGVLLLYNIHTIYIRGNQMKKLLVIITVFIALAGLFIVSPILGKEGKKEPVHYGSAYGWGGGGNF